MEERVGWWLSGEVLEGRLTCYAVFVLGYCIGGSGWVKWNLWSRSIDGYMTSLSFSFSPFCLFRVLRWLDRDVSIVVCGREVGW